MGDSDYRVYAMAMVGCEKRSGFVFITVCRNGNCVDTRCMVDAAIPFVQRDMVMAINVITDGYSRCNGGVVLFGIAVSAMAFLTTSSGMDGAGSRSDGCVCRDR